MNIKPEHAAKLFNFIQSLEAELRHKYDTDCSLKNWQLFQRAFINKDIGFSTYFVVTMSGAIYSSPQDIDDNIVDTAIVKFTSKSGQILRWAVLTTKNGFAVTGKPSASVSAENDVALIGEQIAISNARDELWPLMGYELKSKLSA